MNNITVRLKGAIESFSLDVDFTVPARGVTALFGQSGCGKSSVLRCIAGLQRVEYGFLQINDLVWQDETSFVPAHERPVGYVFQEASLFPHMNVHKNLEFGLKRSKVKINGAKFDDVVSLLGLENLLSRAPQRLSGGERQRVAIGRALLSRPSILLMDEPMAALDQMSKDEIIPYLERLHGSLDIPMIYVSHDMSEVQRLADTMVFLEDGEVRATGPIENVLTDTSLPIAHAREASVVVNASVKSVSKEDGLTKLDVCGAELLVPGLVGDVGKNVRVRIAANDVSLAVVEPSQTTILNVLPVVVMDVSAINETQVNVLCAIGGEGGAQILARITKRSQDTFKFSTSQHIFAQVKGVSMVDK